MGSDSINMKENASSVLREAKEQKVDATGHKIKTRQARWTREETITLLQAKLAVENRVQARSGSSSILASDQNEPKWDSISSNCKQHGVIREPSQCQKRWSNLICDFKKIKTWESEIKNDDESFWIMRSDLRKERKLPGVFDREVYDILDGRELAMAATPLTHVTDMTGIATSGGDQAATPLAHIKYITGLDTSGEHQAPTAAAMEEQENEEVEEIEQGNEKRHIAKRSSVKTGEGEEDLPVSTAQAGSKIQEGLKRRRLSKDENKDEVSLVKVLERNSNMLTSQFETQSINYQLDRNQREEQADNLVTALNKIADALERIADKL